jgi:hypothetical protein
MTTSSILGLNILLSILFSNTIDLFLTVFLLYYIIVVYYIY